MAVDYFKVGLGQLWSGRSTASTASESRDGGTDAMTHMTHLGHLHLFHSLEDLCPRLKRWSSHSAGLFIQHQFRLWRVKTSFAVRIRRRWLLGQWDFLHCLNYKVWRILPILARGGARLEPASPCPHVTPQWLFSKAARWSSSVPVRQVSRWPASLFFLSGAGMPSKPAACFGRPFRRISSMIVLKNMENTKVARSPLRIEISLPSFSSISLAQSCPPATPCLASANLCTSSYLVIWRTRCHTIPFKCQKTISIKRPTIPSTSMTCWTLGL